MLNIVYSGNDQMFKGLYLSILSILRRTKEQINFYFLTADMSAINKNYVTLTKQHALYVEQLVKSFNQNNTFTVYDCSTKFKQYFGNISIERWTPYILLKLLIPQFEFKGDLVLFLDIDVLANQDIKQAFDTDLTNIELCVCHINGYELIYGKDSPYFNSGVMLINLPYVRQTQYFDKAIAYFHEYKPDAYQEEVALNSTFTRIQFWKNEFRFNYPYQDIEEDTVLKHFCTTPDKIIPIKPWDIKWVQDWLNIHNWDEDYAYYTKQMNLFGEEI